MASDYKVLVLPPTEQTSAELVKSGARVRAHRGWLEVLGAEWRSDAQELSTRFLTTAVWWSMQTPMDQVWLFCFHEGVPKRELRFTAEADGWSVNRGEGMPFEDTTALVLWLNHWRSMRKPLAARDGVALLNAFIGNSPAKSKPKPKPKPKSAPKKKAKGAAVGRRPARSKR